MSTICVITITDHLMKELSNKQGDLFTLWLYALHGLNKPLVNPSEDGRYSMLDIHVQIKLRS